MSGKAARGSNESQRGEKEVPKDLMHYLLNIDRETGRRPDRNELNSGSLNIINAGADPFAGVLAAVIFYSSIHCIINVHYAKQRKKSGKCLVLPQKSAAGLSSILVSIFKFV